MKEQYLSGLRLKEPKEIDFTKYPYNILSIRNLTHLDFHPKVTFIVGDNGTGKSTLLEAIAVKYGLNPEGGSKNFSFSTKDTHSKLYEDIILEKGTIRARDAYFLRAESFYNVATEIERLDEKEDTPYGNLISNPPIKGNYGNQSLHEKSHGESFEALLEKRLFGYGVYLLDEPEAALSPMTQIQMLVRIHELVQNHAQFIIATHSPILLSYPNSLIYQIGEDRTYQSGI